MDARKQALANYRRAKTNHEKQQDRGTRDMSVRQTRRMALAVRALQSAYFKLRNGPWPTYTDEAIEENGL